MLDFTNPPPAIIRALPDDLRAMIDAAIAAGKVQRIATGATAQPGYRWDAGAGELVSIGPDPTRNSPKMVRIRAERSREAALRRVPLIAARKEGLTRQQIADRLGISLPTVIRLLRRAIREGEVAK